MKNLYRKIAPEPWRHEWHLWDTAPFRAPPLPFRNRSRRMVRAMLTEVLSALYALGGVAACLCYLPQIHRLRRDVSARRAMSLLAWGGWFGVSTVTLLYAALVVRLPEMMAVAGLNLLCQGIVFALALGQRLADRG